MCEFYSTNTFRKQLSKLLKKPKNGYVSVKLDICKAFENKSFEEIFNTPKMLRVYEEYKQIKYSIGNSAQNLAARNGFRLIYLVIRGKKDENGNQPEKNKIIFQYIFPKRGAYSQENVTEKAIDDFTVEYKEEINILCKHDINNELYELENELISS